MEHNWCVIDRVTAELELIATLGQIVSRGFYAAVARERKWDRNKFFVSAFSLFKTHFWSISGVVVLPRA